MIRITARGKILVMAEPIQGSPPPPPNGTGRSRWRYRRGHGVEFDRVAFFTDAVFAIAMTILIVSVEAPVLRSNVRDPATLLHKLGALYPQFFSFFLAFLLLARYWMAHHEFFSGLKSVDRRLIAINLTYLAFVAFLPFPTSLVGKYEQNPMSVVLFAVCLAIISGLETVAFASAHHRGHLRREMTPELYHHGVIQSSTPVVLFVLSIPLAFFSPTLALLSWLLGMPIGIVVDRRAPQSVREYLAAFDPDDD
jgi:uncharacterized membrane protein